jgi:hypothetical protein
MKSTLLKAAILATLAAVLAGCSKSEDPLNATPNRAVGVAPAGKAPTAN